MRVGNRRKVSKIRSRRELHTQLENRRLGKAEPNCFPKLLIIWCVFFPNLGWVAEVLVWFENHLSVRVVKYDGEPAQHLCPDGPRNIRSRENAGGILGKLREWHGDHESSEPNGLHASKPGSQLTSYGNHLWHFDRVMPG